MPTNWNDLGLWFVTAFLGAALVKLIDLAASGYTDRRARTKQRVNTLLECIKDYGQLTELFRFYAYYSASIVRDENGEFKKDEEGKFVVERRILEPEPRFEEALKALQGTDINSAIAQKIAALRLSSSEVLDVAYELDPSGKLKEGFVDLYKATVWSIELILRDRDTGHLNAKFTGMMNALKNADDCRRELRKKIQSFAK